ncbi:hypothetical protein ABK905_20555 [Acerihabitans sp. KWT182]|uniref:Uncharacterized protein n=1 Tax=Acerihabitans sp. KWT182 TaxID=3157919 RepID=A0AAU7Q7I2_9GAMM
MENYNNLTEMRHQEEIFSRIRAYEILRNLDVEEYKATGKIVAKISNQELSFKAQRFMASMNHELTNSAIKKTLAQDYNRLYVYILKMCTIQMRGPNKSLESKLINLLEFSHYDAHFIGIREILLAKRFFEEGTQFSFFHKVRNNAKDFWSYVRGMAWDLRHQRFLECAITLKLEKDSYNFFPSILTCDKKFIQILDDYTIKAIVFNYKTKEILPFYDTDFSFEIAKVGVKIKDLLTKLTYDDAVRQRQFYQNGPEYLSNLVLVLENELEEVSGIKR